MADNRPGEESIAQPETKAKASPITDKPAAKPAAKPKAAADGAKAEASITKSPKGKTEPGGANGDAKTEPVATKGKAKAKAKTDEPDSDDKITGKPKLSLFGMNLDFSSQGPPGVWGIDLGQCASRPCGWKWSTARSPPPPSITSNIPRSSASPTPTRIS